MHYSEIDVLGQDKARLYRQCQNLVQKMMAATQPEDRGSAVIELLTAWFNSIDIAIVAKILHHDGLGPQHLEFLMFKGRVELHRICEAVAHEFGYVYPSTFPEDRGSEDSTRTVDANEYGLMDLFAQQGKHAERPFSESSRRSPRMSR